MAESENTKYNNTPRDGDFENIRDRFDSDMRRMKDEMGRFKSKLLSSHHRSTFESNTSATTSSSGEAALGRSDGYSSLIQADGENPVLHLKFDVSLYAPEEIVVKTVDNKLLIHAKHEETTGTQRICREYNREVLLPKNCNPELIKSSLSKDGMLTVEAPLPAEALTTEETIGESDLP